MHFARWEAWLALILALLIVTGGGWQMWRDKSRPPIVIETQGEVKAVPLIAKPPDQEVFEQIEAVQDVNSGIQPSPSPSGEGPSAGCAVNINTAGISELVTLPGIGPVLAERIIAYREAWGPFDHVLDLREVSGIGEKRLEQLIGLICTE